MTTKIIFITGGVLSGIGKGIASASIGAILKGANFRIFSQKLDGYLNVDPGTMNPTQHGEVFVTDDGTETDLDLGHYERFLDVNLNQFSSFTTGKLYEEIITRERSGDYLGGTVQIVPHLTDLVKEKIDRAASSSDAEILIVEIGGTVGDMENEYFLEAARQLQSERWKENVMFIHVALLPFLKASKELKTKPIQHSVRTLMSYGISPDFVIVRADEHIPENILEKIAHSVGLSRQAIIASETLASIYQVPLEYHKQSFWGKILSHFGLEYSDIDMQNWENLCQNINTSTEIIDIAMIGKYALEDAYYSLNEGLKCAGFFYKKRVKLHFLDPDDIERNGTEMLAKFDGICIPWGFGGRSTEGMILATQYARMHNVPFLGVCLGSQVMAIEYARNVAGIIRATSEEWGKPNDEFIVHIMEDQKNLTQKWGSMRLGLYQCILAPDSLAYKIYKNSEISERHRHRYEFNNDFREILSQKWLKISGTSADGKLVEIIENPSCDFMLATQAHPEFISRPASPHSLFLAFVDAINTKKRS